MLGHDLRNPLGAIRNSATYLLRAQGLSANQTKAAARIVLSSARMQRMIDDLLDFTRTRLGTALPVARSRMDLGEACRSVVDELRALHPGQAVTVDCSGELSGHWDGPRIGQLLSNLIANAIQYGAADMPVTVGLRVDHEAAVVNVHNHGRAISTKVRRTLFEPMLRVGVAMQQPAERHEGSSGLGLGLYIARQIVLAHGGEISVESFAAVLSDEPGHQRRLGQAAAARPGLSPRGIAPDWGFS